MHCLQGGGPTAPGACGACSARPSGSSLDLGWPHAPCPGPRITRATAAGGRAHPRRPLRTVRPGCKVRLVTWRAWDALRGRQCVVQAAKSVTDPCCLLYSELGAGRGTLSASSAGPGPSCRRDPTPSDPDLFFPVLQAFQRLLMAVGWRPCSDPGLEVPRAQPCRRHARPRSALRTLSSPRALPQAVPLLGGLSLLGRPGLALPPP